MKTCAECEIEIRKNMSTAKRRFNYILIQSSKNRPVLSILIYSQLIIWPSGIGTQLGRTEQVVSLIPGSVGYISYPMFIEPTIAQVPSRFSGYIWRDTKIVLKKNIS